MTYRRILFALILALVGSVHAADSEPTPAKQDPVWLTEARTHIEANNYAQAIQTLQAANEASSADWNNLMGYSLRKQQPSDLLGADKHYQAALDIDPKHRGALEYYGELKLMQGDLAGAESLLAKLDKICFFGCEEYSELKEAVEKFNASK